MEVQNLNKKLDKISKKGKAVGVNLALFDSKGIIYNYNYGYANKEQGMKSNNDSLYMIGSNTKVLTALAILKLMEEGKLSLEDDVKKHIPEFEVKSYFQYDKISIKNLLMHRSGLVSDLFHLILGKTRDYHEVIPELRETYLTATPGKMFSYSNVGYTVLGIVIERVSGLSYTEYIQEEIAKTLGIQVHFLLNEEDRHKFTSSVSLCYDRKGKAVEDNLSTLLPAGSNTYMSLSDFIKFGQMFLKKDGALLKKETLELMETLDLEEPIDQEVYNVGFGLIHKQYDMGEQVGKVLGHGGNTTCHHSMFNYIPELNVGIVVMTNSQRAIGFYATAGMTVLVEYLKEKGIVVEESKAECEHIKCDSNDMVGKYATGLGMMEIKRNNKSELVTKVSKIPIRLCPCKDGYYQCTPVKVIHKIPIFKSSIQGMRLKPATYLGEDIMLFEQSGKYHKTKGVIGCKYERTDIPDSFRAACGNYTIADEMFKDIKCKCQLKVEGEVLVLEIAALNVKLNSCLKVVGEDLAILQGFGRLAREMVKLQKKDDGYYLTFSGIVFKKI